MEPPRAWIRDTSVIESGRTCAVDPWMRCSNPSRIPITSQPEFTASIVAAEMTELIPGAGPPPHRIPSLGLRSPMGGPRRVRAWMHSLASAGGVSQATPGAGRRCPVPRRRLPRRTRAALHQRPRRAQARDLHLAVTAHVAQDLVGVAAEAGRHAADPAVALGHAPRDADVLAGADHRVRKLD